MKKKSLLMFEILIFLLIGLLAGIFAGMFPGIHPNLLALLSGSVLISMNFFPNMLCFITFMVSMGIANSLVNPIPSILFSAPESGTALSVLPGHKLLLSGYGYYAIKLTVIGAVGSLVVCSMLLPILIKIIPSMYELIRPNIHWILSVVVIYMIITEKKRAAALFCFFSAGLIGIMGNRLPINQNFFLFSVLTGLFGLPMLILSIRNKVILPKQKIKDKLLSRKTLNRSIISGSLMGFITGLLPGIGPAQATVLATIGQEKSNEGFLLSIGAVTMVNTLFSFLAIWLIGNPRNGVAVVIDRFVAIGFNEFLLMMAVSIIACGLSAIATLKIAKMVLNTLQKIDYVFINKSIALLLCILVFLFSGLYGLLLLAITTSLGIFTNLSNIRRTHMMGVLLLPCIIFFANI